ncbi:MAG: helix-turn-helix domain-containing protein [Planctomycetota bacterium]|nr:helix-turn-helix domain-containing protein [Planctomycetota bacterium]
MKRTSIVLSVSQRHRLIREAARTKDAALRTRYMIVRHTAEGKSQREIARMLGCSVSTVKRTRTRWRESGEAGLMDRREDNTPAKADELYAADWLPRRCSPRLMAFVFFPRGETPTSRIPASINLR